MATKMLSKEDESAEHVTWADQQLINSFSKYNARLADREDQLEALSQTKEALDDVLTELELADEDELVPYKVGDAFVELKLEEAQERLEKEKENVDEQVEKLEEEVVEIKAEMDRLKVQLYSKFGRAINLEK
ncbi:hypothetical protein YB2330_003162 [Saitoella coloradoensis]